MKNMILALTLTFIFNGINAQTFNLEHDHSTIQVVDIDKSVAFYSDILQLKELNTPWPENPMIRFFGIGSYQQLHIAQVDAFGDIKINKVLHLAFSTKDFDGYLNYLKEKGIVYSNFSEEIGKNELRPDGVRQIYFQDPDGYWIEINDAEH